MGQNYAMFAIGVINEHYGSYRSKLKFPTSRPVPSLFSNERNWECGPHDLYSAGKIFRDYFGDSKKIKYLRPSWCMEFRRDGFYIPGNDKDYMETVPWKTKFEKSPFVSGMMVKVTVSKRELSFFINDELCWSGMLPENYGNITLVMGMQGSQKVTLL